MKKIRLRVAVLEEKLRELDLSKREFAEKAGLTGPTIYRTCLPPQAPGYNKPGERFIAAILTTLPGAKFEDYFYFE